MSLMHLRGARFCVAELPQLIHLGGFSARAEDEPADYYRGLPDRIAAAFGRRAAQHLLYLADSWYAIRRMSPGVTAAESRVMPFSERRILEGRIRKRLGTARYFRKLLQNLLTDASRPHCRYSDTRRRAADRRRDRARIARTMRSSIRIGPARKAFLPRPEIYAWRAAGGRQPCDAIRGEEEYVSKSMQVQGETLA